MGSRGAGATLAPVLEKSSLQPPSPSSVERAGTSAGSANFFEVARPARLLDHGGVDTPFDVIVIGGGSAGLVSAGILGNAGARVALVEREDLGGECLFTGCVPSKTLLAAAKSFHGRRQARLYGLPEPPSQDVDLAAVMAAVQRSIDEIHEGPEVLHAEGVEEVVFGPARFVDGRVLEVDGRRLTGKRFVICTGSRPRIPELPGIHETPWITSNTLWKLRQLPRHLVVVGAGPVGCEMAQAFQRLGTQVTLLGRARQLLPSDDSELAALLQDHLREEGMEVLTGTEAIGLERTGDGNVAVRARRGEEEITRVADQLLLAVGRAPNVEDLDLGRAGVAWTKRGVTVDRHLRTTASHIWALGDVTGLSPFSHMAEAQARAVAAHIAFGLPTSFDSAWKVWATFTDPELARVGPGEKDARRLHRRVQVLRLPLGTVDRAITEKRTRGMIKVITAGWRGKVVAAHILAPHAGELLQEWIVACQRGLRIDQVSNTIHVYPSWSMLNQRVADRRMRAWTERPGFRRWMRRVYRWWDRLRPSP